MIDVVAAAAVGLFLADPVRREHGQDHDTLYLTK